MKFSQFFLWLLMILGFILRIWTVNYGLPVSYFADESKFVYVGLNLGGGYLGPHLLDTFYPYLCFFFDAIYIVVCNFLGIYKRLGDAWVFYKMDPTPYFVIARFVSTFFGVLTIPLTYLIGKKIFDRTVGILAAFLLTFSYFHVQYSSVAYRDITFVFFIMASLWFSLRALEEGKQRDFILSGLAAGFALSTKWCGPPVLMWGPLVLLLRAGGDRRNFISEFFGTRNLLFFLFIIIGFTIGNPSWILHFSKFKTHALGGWNIFRPGGAGQIGRDHEGNWIYYLNQTLPEGLGLPLAVVAILGCLLLVVLFRREYFLFLSFPFVYFAIAGVIVIRETRYMLPVIPFLCIAAAFFTHFAVSKITGNRGRTFGILLGMVSLLLIAPTLVKSLRYSYLKMMPDTQNLAYQWMQERIPGGSGVLISGFIYPPKISGIEMLDPSVLRQEATGSLLKSLKEYREEGFDYLVIDEWHLGMVQNSSDRKPHYREAREKYRRLVDELKESAELVATFTPYRDSKILFDPENILFATRHLWKMDRLGPQIWIYRL